MQPKKENGRQQRQPRLLYREWLAHIAACSERKMSATVYCVEQGLSVKIFKKYEWRRRREATLLKREPFIPVTLMDDAPMKVDDPYEIVFARGIIVRVPASRSLSEIVSALENT